MFIDNGFSAKVFIFNVVTYLFQIEKLQQLLQDPEACKINFSAFEALPLPLDPEVKVHGIIPNVAMLFKVHLVQNRYIKNIYIKKVTVSKF